MKKLVVLVILFIATAGYEPFMGVKRSFTDNLVGLEPECNLETYLPTFGAASQLFKDGKPVIPGVDTGTKETMGF